MTVKDYGNPDAGTVLVQAVDNNSIEMIENEVRMITELTGADFCLKAMVIDDWFRDLSPWQSPAVFGNNAFGDGAGDTLDYILDRCQDKDRTYYIGGYSLSGLFALWTAFQTDTFRGVAAASPSMWFPGFTDYMKNHDIGCDLVYLSLGDREAKTKNKVMATVDDCILTAHETLSAQGVTCTLEWNKGNHFTDADKRCAQAFAWIMSVTRSITPMS